jgi:succinyl-diaminopimelate desuccinylase
MNPAAANASLHSQFEARRAEMIALLEESVRINSVTGQEEALGHFFAQRLERMGFQVVRHPCKGRINVAASIGQGERALVFQAHLDTVKPQPEAWTHDPWQPHIEGGRLYGLGSSDIKGSMVSLAYAGASLKDAGLPGRFICLFTIEEETTGDGTNEFLNWALDMGYLKAASTAAVVTEPTGLTHLCLGNRGSDFVTVIIKGKGGHGSRPHLAKNPIPKALELVHKAAALQAAFAQRYGDAEMGEPTITPTAFLAGDTERTNSIPESARVILDCRLTPKLFVNDLALFRRELRSFLASLAEPGYSFEVIEEFPREGHKLEQSHVLAKVAVSTLRLDMGRTDAEIRYTPAGNDAVFFGVRGIPTVNKLGPGAPEKAHQADEYIELDNLVLGAELYARLALNYFDAVS